MKILATLQMVSDIGWKVGEIIGGIAILFAVAVGLMIAVHYAAQAK